MPPDAAGAHDVNPVLARNLPSCNTFGVVPAGRIRYILPHFACLKRKSLSDGTGSSPNAHEPGALAFGEDIVGLSIALHADDFGLNAAVTDGILRGFRHGLLTSTSILANAPHSLPALKAWQELSREQLRQLLPSAALRRELDDVRRTFDFGVHLNLTQGRPLTGERYPAPLLDSEGRFPGVACLFRRLRARSAEQFISAVHDELAAQIGWVVDHGVSPTHLNGHQYIELLPQVSSLLPKLLERFSIPVRRLALEPALARTTLWHGFRLRAWALALVKQYYARRAYSSGRASYAAPRAYFGTAHAGKIDIRILDLFLKHAGQGGMIEIGVHPGCDEVRIRPHELCEGWHDPLASQRSSELALLESPLLAERLRSRGVKLGRLTDLLSGALRRAA